MGDGFTALGARLMTALLALFVVAKVQEKLEKFGKGELDVVRGALIPLAVLGLVYRYGVGLMIRGARRRRWAIVPDVSSRKLTMLIFEMLLVT